LQQKPQSWFYTDADGATQSHSCAISGYAFLLDSGVVSWFSRKQELITLSTAESKYVAATHAAKELYWIKKLLYDIAPDLDKCITLHCNNEAAIALIHSENYHMRTKHMNIHCKFIHKEVVTSML